MTVLAEQEQAAFKKQVAGKVTAVGGITIGHQLDRLIAFLATLANSSEQREFILRHWKEQMAETPLYSDTIDGIADAARVCFRDPRAR